MFNTTEKKILVEKWNDLIEFEKPGLKKPKDKGALAVLLENQEKYINENNTTGDLAQYNPILIPAVRRIFPSLVANEIVGIQPMSSPTAYAYALRFGYSMGDGRSLSLTERTETGDAKIEKYVAFVVKVSITSGALPENLNSLSISINSDDLGSVIFSEKIFEKTSTEAYYRVLVSLTDSGDLKGATLNSAITIGSYDATIHAIHKNEAAYNLIFKNYSNTQDSERAKFSDGSLRKMKFFLDRTQIEAQTRKLGAQYTLELAQDLRAVHGLDAETELTNILEYEIAAEIDRELVDTINALSKKTAPWDYSSSDGNWEQEVYRTLYSRIIRECNKIALTTRRGVGNFIIVSANVLSALESLSSFFYSPVNTDVQMSLGISKVGSIDNRINVYLDSFALYDYVTVGYKGQSSFDTGIIYCPYVPLMPIKVTDPDTLQPALGFMTRYAIAKNLFGTENYYRTFEVLGLTPEG